MTCSSVVAATMTGALVCATTSDRNIGRTIAKPNTATPARAMAVARRGESSTSNAQSERKNHSFRPGTGRGRRPTGRAAVHDRFQPVSLLLTYRYVADMTCGASARSLGILSRSAQ